MKWKLSSWLKFKMISKSIQFVIFFSLVFFNSKSLIRNKFYFTTLMLRHKQVFSERKENLNSFSLFLKYGHLIKTYPSVLLSFWFELFFEPNLTKHRLENLFLVWLWHKFTSSSFIYWQSQQKLCMLKNYSYWGFKWNLILH